MKETILILFILWSGYKDGVHNNSEFGKQLGYENGYKTVLVVESLSEAEKTVFEYDNYGSRKVLKCRLVKVDPETLEINQIKMDRFKKIQEVE